jgi:hypothetical protein
MTHRNNEINDNFILNFSLDCLTAFLGRTKRHLFYLLIITLFILLKSFINILSYFICDFIKKSDRHTH